MRLLAIVFLALSPVVAQSQLHPLDGLTTAEYWTAYETLRAGGHVTPETVFASVLLSRPAKSAVLSWKPGSPVARQADVILHREGKTFAAIVDLAGKRVVQIGEAAGKAPFVMSEFGSATEGLMKDERFLEAMRKRGIKDLRMIDCFALPLSYQAFPEQKDRRIGLVSCSTKTGAYHSWGRSIEGLTILVDVASKKVVRFEDKEVFPVAASDTRFEEIPENHRPHSTPLRTEHPVGPSFRIKDGEVQWQNWHFRFRLDQRIGVVLNLVRYRDGGRERSVMYEGSVSELFVPYMDSATGWNNRAFLDAGQFYASSGFMQPLRPGLDCPKNASWFPGVFSTERGSPVIRDNMVCLFERNVEGPAWRHMEGDQIYGRPTRQLILRSTAVVGNYDYIMDWRFDPDGTIEVAVGATGIIETRAMREAKASGHTDHSQEETGQFVGENTLGVNHDHYFSYRLDLDVDGPANSFMVHRMEEKKLTGDPMRKSIWVAKPFLAQREQDAIMDIRLERPSMWMFMNPAVKGPQNYPTAYEVMPGVTAKSLMSSDDPIQKVGAFSEHQFWVTPYDPRQLYASGTYVTDGKGDDGLAAWTKANRPIVNTDLVGWYTLGFHHIPRAEDWPVMPTMWHSFQIRPFHFFGKNPVLDLPKSLDAVP
jgi:primary-amine oxidase